MRMIPLFKCRNMKDALAFYTGILDFELKYPNESADDWVVDLINGDMEMQLTVLENNSLFGSVVNILVEDVDGLFSKYVSRGLDISNKEGSPVHQGPIDQSWGMREFYVTDMDGNTLRFRKPFELPRAFYKNVWPYLEDEMNLPVRNVTTAVPYYTNVLNFQLVSMKDEPVRSAVLQRDAIRICIAENGGDPGNEGCFFEVDSIETVLKELQLNGLKKAISDIKIEKHGDKSWKVFYVVAPDGLCFCLGEPQNN